MLVVSCILKEGLGMVIVEAGRELAVIHNLADI
jgi:hypothetical protein